MSFLLDSDTSVFWLRGRAPVVERLQTVGWSSVAISIVTLAELEFGVVRSGQPEENRQRLDRFIDQCKIIPLTPSIVRQYARLKAGLWRQGEKVDEFDMLIGATALETGRVMVTHNLQHFRRIPGLSLEDWYLSDQSDSG